jgi:serine protease Do
VCSSMNDEVFRKSMQEKISLALVALLGGVVGSIFWQEWNDREATREARSANTEVRQEVAAEDRQLTNLVAQNSPGVVSIVVKKNIASIQGGFPFFFLPPVAEEGKPERVGSGSGFFATKDGLIVTNKHVVADEEAEYFVYRAGDETEYPAKVVARDPVNDIAFLKIEGKNFPALKLGDSDTLQVGESAIAIGNSLGEFANSVSRGIISGKQRSLSAGNMYGETETLSGVIQTDAAINPGNSGGPLFNLRGEVIGVNVAVAQGAENIGFALPVNQIKIRLEQVLKTRKIEVPYLGIRYVMLNDALKKELGVKYESGALVLRGRELTDFAVVPGSPAQKAGILEGDVIVKLGGKNITVESDIASVLASRKVGDTLSVTLWRQGKEEMLSVTLETRP